MLKEMFYWLMYFLKKIGRTELLEFNSYLLISMLVGFNILTVLLIVCYLSNINLKEFDPQTIKIAGGIFAIGVIIFNYFHLYKNRDHICKQYDDLSGQRRIKGMVIFWFYALLSIALLFIVGVNLSR